MVARPYVPDTGDLAWLTSDPQAGHEQSGRRPALILSPRAYNARARLALACPITSQKKGYPFEVPLPAGQAVAGVVWPIRSRTSTGRPAGRCSRPGFPRPSCWRSGSGFGRC